MEQWYYAEAGRAVGPYSEEEIRAMVRAGKLNGDSRLYNHDLASWTPLKHLPHLLPESQESGFSIPNVPPPPAKAHEIDYRIIGEEMQFVEVELDPGESAIAEAGSMMYMTQSIQMETIFGDGSENQGGVFGKLLGAGKRLITGESLFTTVFTHGGNSGKEHVAFAAPYPGKIIPVDLRSLNGTIICQKDSFLAAAKGVSIGIHFQKKFGAGLFGGEGFIMQRLDGDGMAFLHAGGTIQRIDLKPGQHLRVDTGCLVGLTSDVSYDIEFAGGVKTVLFGGEGLFFASLRGPGSVWLQSLPFSRLAGRIFAAAPQVKGQSTRGEGSILGGLGNLMDGDNF